MGLGEPGVELARVHGAVQRAHHQDHVDRPFEPQLGRRGRDDQRLDLAEDLRRAREEVLEAQSVERHPLLFGPVRVGARADELALLCQGGREDLREPAFARGELEDCHVRLEAVEVESLDGVTILVALRARGPAVLSGDDGEEGGLPVGIRLLRERLDGGVQLRCPPGELGDALRLGLRAVLLQVRGGLGLGLLLRRRLGGRRRSGRILSRSRGRGRGGGRGCGRGRGRHLGRGSGSAGREGEEESDRQRGCFHGHLGEEAGLSRRVSGSR